MHLVPVLSRCSQTYGHKQFGGLYPTATFFLADSTSFDSFQSH